MSSTDFQGVEFQNYVGLVVNGKVQKWFDFPNIFVLKENKECDSCLELTKYVQIGNLVLDKKESKLSLE